MLCSMKSVLDMAEEGGYAVPAFNIYNFGSLMGVKNAAKETGAPVILQMYTRLFDTGLAKYLMPALKEVANELKTPVAIHLDHGAGMPQAVRAIKYGATSVMIDASTKAFEENVETTRAVVNIAKCGGITVEGELGHVGSAANGDEAGSYTEVGAAVEFVKQTGVDALAVMVGTAHGKYKKPPKLDIQRTADIAAATGIPLVLHGGSGIPDDQIRAAVKAGICKVNYATGLCYAFMDTLAAQIDTRPALDLFMKKPIEAVQAFAENRIELVGAAGKV